MRHVIVRLLAVTLACILTAGILAGGGRLLIFGEAPAARPESTPPAAKPTASSTPIPTATPTPTPTPTATPTPTPSASTRPTPSPLAITPFRFSGRSYLGLVTGDVDRVFATPLAGVIEIRFYQFIDGEVRVGSNVPSLPFFPYITVVTSDARLVYRPGALGSVTELLVTNGAQVAVGDPIFRIAAEGRSSWATFYDARAPYNVVVSLQTLGGRDLDASPYFAG